MTFMVALSQTMSWQCQFSFFGRWVVNGIVSKRDKTAAGNFTLSSALLNESSSDSTAIHWHNRYRRSGADPAARQDNCDLSWDTKRKRLRDPEC